VTSFDASALQLAVDTTSLCMPSTRQTSSCVSTASRQTVLSCCAQHPFEMMVQLCVSTELQRRCVLVAKTDSGQAIVVPRQARNKRDFFQDRLGTLEYTQPAAS
jgi:hypothetical protein